MPPRLTLDTRYNENALQPSGEFYSCLAPAAADTDALPTPGTLLFGTGTSVLADTRFGEYQLGSKRVSHSLCQQAGLPCDCYTSSGVGPELCASVLAMCV